MEKIKIICEERKIFLIEDCAQGLFSKFYKKPLGTFGDISTFSLQVTKNISAGEGGVVTTTKLEFERVLKF